MYFYSLTQKNIVSQRKINKQNKWLKLIYKQRLRYRYIKIAQFYAVGSTTPTQQLTSRTTENTKGTLVLPTFLPTKTKHFDLQYQPMRISIA